jgi:16S rRNA processing protein RimM
MTRPEWIEVGRVSRPHGVHGEVRIRPDSDNPERFAEGSCLHARPWRASMAGSCPGERLQVTIDTVRGDPDFPIVAFRGIVTREAAEGLRGHVLEVPATELPPLSEDEFYPFELTGLVAKDRAGVVLGRVVEVIESPAHGLLAIRLVSGQELLVPFVSAAISAVLVEEGYLVVESGFLELAGGETASESSGLIGKAERQGGHQSP